MHFTTFNCTLHPYTALHYHRGCPEDKVGLSPSSLQLCLVERGLGGKGLVVR